MTILNTLTALAKMSGTSIKEGLDLMNKAQEKVDEGYLTWEYFEDGVNHHPEVLHAFVEGAEVEFYSDERGGWATIRHPAFLEGLKYRVKGDAPTDKVTEILEMIHPISFKEEQVSDVIEFIEATLEEGIMDLEDFKNGVMFHPEALKAFVLGLPIEVKENGSCWYTVEAASFLPCWEYRVKPSAIWSYLPDDAKYLTKDHADEYADDEWYWHTELPYHHPVGDGSGDWYWMSDGCMQCLRNVKIPELDALGIDFVERPE